MSEDRAEYVTVNAQGRIIIPASIRKALLIREGSRMSARVVDGALVLERPEDMLARIQAKYAEAKRKGAPDAVKELIAERRAEARREAAGK
jgi:AbrB family looped-hinge helix DNA binding protein